MYIKASVLGSLSGLKRSVDTAGRGNVRAMKVHK
jgi:hypothetical protein